jgi:uncharacterized OB-fold protein
LKKKKPIRSPYRDHKKKNSGRICRSCGKDAYPNFFFCPSCHHRVSHQVEAVPDADSPMAD